jgi:hypothetical protein
LGKEVRAMIQSAFDMLAAAFLFAGALLAYITKKGGRN